MTISSVRLFPLRVRSVPAAVGAVVLSFGPALVGCAARAPAEPVAPRVAEAAPASASASPPPSATPSPSDAPGVAHGAAAKDDSPFADPIDATRTLLRASICGAASPLFACTGARDEASCGRTFDARWPKCAKALPADPGDADFKTLGDCVADGFGTRTLACFEALDAKTAGTR